MCGRARCTLQRQQIAQLAGVAVDEFVDGDKYRPCENMGPGRYGAVIFRAKSDGSTPHKATEKKNGDKPKKLQAMRWGLIPSFTKPNAKPDHFIMFNARSESLHERPAFRRLLETRRCVVISEGYYEWQQINTREKQPYYIYRTTGPFKFAGLYDCWTNEQGETMSTYTILTTDISPEMAWMHTRTPVILTDEGASRWLSDAKFDSLRDLLVAYRGDDLKWHAVDRRVGSTKYQSDNCANEVDIKHAGDITAFFGSADVGGATKSKLEEDATVDDVIDGTSESPVKQPQMPQMKASGQSALQEPSMLPTQPFKSPPPHKDSSSIKFLFQQQHMVRQADEIHAASKGIAATAAPTTTAAYVPASPLLASSKLKRANSPKHPFESPKRMKKTVPSPKKTPTKNPQRGTLLAYFKQTP